MRLKIGSEEFEGRHPGRSAEYETLVRDHREAAGRAPVSVFRWDCRKPGLLAKPDVIAVPVHVTGAWPDAQTGAVDAAAAAARLAGFTRRVEPAAASAQGWVDQALPPVQFTVPWKTFRPLLTPAVGFHLLAWPDYLDMLFTPAAPPPAAAVMISLPVAVLFQAVVTHRCRPPAEGEPKAGAEVLDPVLRSTSALPAVEVAFVDAWAAGQRRLVAEGGPLPSPEAQRARDAAAAAARDAWRRRLSGT